MKKSPIVWALAALTIVAALVGVAQAQKDKKVIYVSSGKATYKPSPMGGVSQQVLVGDRAEELLEHEVGLRVGEHRRRAGAGACLAAICSGLRPPRRRARAVRYREGISRTRPCLVSAGRTKCHPMMFQTSTQRTAIEIPTRSLLGTR